MKLFFFREVLSKLKLISTYRDSLVATRNEAAVFRRNDRFPLILEYRGSGSSSRGSVVLSALYSLLSAGFPRARHSRRKRPVGVFPP